MCIVCEINVQQWWSALCLSIASMDVSIQPSSTIPSGCSYRILSRCQFNSHSRRGVHGERSRFDGRERNGRIRFAVVFSDGYRNEKIAGHIPSVVFFCSLARNYLKTNKDTLSWYKFCSCPFEFATLLSELSVCA